MLIFFLITVADFEYLLTIIQKIRKIGPRLRDAVQIMESVQLTLRLLATGES